MRASSSTARWESDTDTVVPCAAVAIPVMLAAISVEPVAASATLRFISFVVAVCSSTAAAMVTW